MTTLKIELVIEVDHELTKEFNKEYIEGYSMRVSEELISKFEKICIKKDCLCTETNTEVIVE